MIKYLEWKCINELFGESEQTVPANNEPNYARTGQFARDYPFANFINWYDQNRGKWKEVMRAAKENPNLAGLIGTAEQETAKQGTIHPIFNYEGNVYRKQGGLANHIESAVAIHRRRGRPAAAQRAGVPAVPGQTGQDDRRPFGSG